MFKKDIRQGRSEREREAYFALYVERLSDARTPPEAFFNILLITFSQRVTAAPSQSEPPEIVDQAASAARTVQCRERYIRG